MARGKGEGSIYKRCEAKGAGHGRGNHNRCKGYWIGAVSYACAGGHTRKDGSACQGGERRKLRVVRRSKAEVVAEVSRLKARVKGSRGHVPDRCTVSEWLDIWQAQCLDHVTASTRDQYRTRINAWITPHVGDVALDQLDRADVQAMMRALSGKSASVRVQALGLLRKACAEAKSRYLIPDNPCGTKASNDAIRGPHIEPKTDDTPTPEEIEAILAAAEGDRLMGAAAFLGLKYGLRMGEVQGLRWSNVTDDHLTVIRSTTKTAAGARTVPLTPTAKAVLARHRKVQTAERLAAPVWADPDLVFTDEIGRRLDARKVRLAWHQLCERAGVRRCRFHASRHAAATTMFNTGAEIETVAKVIGHKSVATTRAVYVRVLDDLERKAFLDAGA